MGAELLVVGRPRVPPETQIPVACDQAVFSSVRTLMRQGYRILAASKGLTPGEKKEINQRSPSHGGLCKGGPEATGTSFYRLDSGRLALAHSRDAGAEHTGRGVRRIYTHITVMSADDLDRFAFNPFDVLQAAEAAGAFEPQLKPPTELPPLELEAPASAVSDRVAAAAEQVGPDWLTFAASRAMEGDRLVLAGELSPEALVEAILLGVPGPLRGELSFSAGLRLSIGRKYAIAAVNGDLKQTRRLVRGQRLEYFEPLDERGAPQHPSNPWSRMIDTHWRGGMAGELAALTSQPIPDCSPEALARIGALSHDICAARTASLGDLLCMADARLDGSDASEVEANLRRRLVRTLQSRLRDRLSTEEHFADHWPALVRLMRRSRRGADLALPAAAVVLERLSVVAPVQAAAYALEAVNAASTFDVRERLSSVLSIVLNGLRHGLVGAPLDTLDRGRSVLTEWQSRLPQFTEVDGLLEEVNDRLANA